MAISTEEKGCVKRTGGCRYRKTRGDVENHHLQRAGHLIVLDMEDLVITCHYVIAPVSAAGELARKEHDALAIGAFNGNIPAKIEMMSMDGVMFALTIPFRVIPSCETLVEGSESLLSLPGGIAKIRSQERPPML